MTLVELRNMCDNLLEADELNRNKIVYWVNYRDSEVYEVDTLEVAPNMTNVRLYPEEKELISKGILIG